MSFVFLDVVHRFEVEMQVSARASFFVRGVVAGVRRLVFFISCIRAVTFSAVIRPLKLIGHDFQCRMGICL